MDTRKKLLPVALGAILSVSGMSSASAISLVFGDNASPAAFGTNPDTFGASNLTALLPSHEFRMIDDLTGTGGGGPPSPSKDIFFGGETWTFASGSGGAMTGVGGTGTNGGASVVGVTPGFGTSAAPTAGTNSTISQNNALFVGAPFTFLAPTTGSLTGAAYGPATLSITGTTSGAISVLFPVLETQWFTEAWFPLGAGQAGTDTPGVLFSGLFNCTGSNCSFRMQAQETFNGITTGSPGAGDLPDEDPVKAGFGSGWTAQFDVVGTFSTAVPIPAAVWLFGSGLLGLVGLARKRKTR